MDFVALILIAAAVRAGIAVGWFLGSRPAADWTIMNSGRFLSTISAAEPGPTPRFASAAPTASMRSFISKKE